MHIRAIARNFAAIGVISATLAFTAPALADDAPGADMANAPMMAQPPIPAAPPPPRLPDARPVWSGPAHPPMAPAPVALQVDPRMRDVWLAECRRRMDIYYGGDWDHGHGWKRHDRHHRGEVRTMGYEYCEAYFDDYYRYYAQAGYGHGHGHAMMMHTVTRAAPAERNCVEEEHVSYEPVRTRYVPRRPVIREKRVRDKRIRVQ